MKNLEKFEKIGKIWENLEKLDKNWSLIHVHEFVTTYTFYTAS